MSENENEQHEIEGGMTDYPAEEMGSSNTAEQAESEYGVGTTGDSDDLPAADEVEE